MQDFDLCLSCNGKGHSCPMENSIFKLMDDGSGISLEERKNLTRLYIEKLVHACQCKAADCRLPSCLIMKKVVTHMKTCKRRTRGGCRICKSTTAVFCHHARHCKEAKCPVLFCYGIKQKFKQVQTHKRATVMANTRPQETAVQSAPLVSPSIPADETIGPGINPIEAPQSHHQPSISIKLEPQTPPANEPQVVEQVQEEATRQQPPHVRCYKVTPDLDLIDGSTQTDAKQVDPQENDILKQRIQELEAHTMTMQTHMQTMLKLHSLIEDLPISILKEKIPDFNASEYHSTLSNICAFEDLYKQPKIQMKGSLSLVNTVAPHSSTNQLNDSLSSEDNGCLLVARCDNVDEITLME